MPVHKKLKQHKILLDTHVWIWEMFGDKRLSKSFRKEIEEIRKNGIIYLSAISIWELGMLVEKKRVELDMDCLDWVEHALLDCTLLPLAPRTCILSCRLPENDHGDPADRIIIASANESNSILVTHDQKILNYGKGKFLDVYDPCS